jgi:hypothetical protein
LTDVGGVNEIENRVALKNKREYGTSVIIKKYQETSRQTTTLGHAFTGWQCNV